PLGIRPLSHGAQVVAASFSPDGRRVVTAGNDATARVWDVTTGDPVSPPLRLRDVVEHAVFSPDGRRVLTASWDRTARVWDASTGQPITPPLRHAGRVGSAEFSPDGRRVVTGAGVWDAWTGRLLTRLSQRRGQECAAFSPDGRRVVTYRADDAGPAGDPLARLW